MRSNSFDKKTNIINNIKRKDRIDLFIGNMPYNIDEKQLRDWFEKNGLKKIEFDSRIAVDKETGQNRGFGFISVYDKNDIPLVLKLNGKDFNHRKLVINESKKK